MLQILSLLPSRKGKSVIELGAGIGRYTAELAKEAEHVLAMDFIESAIKKVCIILAHSFYLSLGLHVRSKARNAYGFC